MWTRRKKQNLFYLFLGVLIGVAASCIEDALLLAAKHHAGEDVSHLSNAAVGTFHLAP